MPEIFNQIALEAIKVPGLLVEIYGDIAKPGVKQAGKALETIVGLGNTILWPVALLNEKSRVSLQKNLEKYRKELEGVAEEKIVNIAPEIGVPIAEKLSYVQDDHLSDLYVKLLAKASNSDTLGQAHPSFVNVINNLSPDEAILMEYFIKNRELPFVVAKADVPGTSHHKQLKDLIVKDEVKNKLIFPSNTEAYLSNLSGLGLVSIYHDKWIADDEVYNALEEQCRPRFTEIIAREPVFKDHTLSFARGIIHRTSFGLQFIQACHAKSS